eukprot:TRINITY_DN1010_c0_g1_i2.p1 TRINITY_DN1010_c0_g1~~TRINITY_DN1010_c0_g1_i2.p1  ORF type:complete len:941 (+),score=447.67 TRINITY_DN1010_c0_g1_i2:43-2823(+)
MAGAVWRCAGRLRQWAAAAAPVRGAASAPGLRYVSSSAVPGCGAATMSDLAAQVAEQGDRVRELKAKKADKSAIAAEVDKLLKLKAELAKQDPAAAAAPAPAAKKAKKAAPPTTDLAAQVAEQGDRVRELKAKKADKSAIAAEVDKLLKLKAELAKQDPAAAAAPAPAAKKAKKAGVTGSPLQDLDHTLAEQPYLGGFKPTKLDSDTFDEMFKAHPAVAAWAARMARYYPAERREMLAQAAPAAAAKKPAPKAAAPAAAADQAPAKGTNFLRELIKKDLAPGGRHHDRLKRAGDVVRTRFPPEPNGYLHIGHVKSICLNFGIAKDFGGRCHLRYDDTNPTSEKQEFIDQIEADVRWLGFDWGEHKYFASEYFGQLYEWALHLIREGKAYVDSQSPEDLKKNRGDLHTPGKNSPFRDRTVAENLELFQEMKDGKHPEGKHVLRAKVNMADGNMNMRDPLLYRVLHKEHPHTGNKWCIYPLYDFAHGQEDAIEGITHSFCTLEFDLHRALYDWFLDNLPAMNPRPVQTEFNKLKIPGTVLSKRKLKLLVERRIVDGWDDPRLPTICGLRRRGMTPEGLRNFIDKVGFSRSDSVIDQANLDESIRDDLDRRCPRRFAVLDPVKLVLVDYDEGKEEEFEVQNHPSVESMGKRKMKLSRELFIERDDYMDEPPASYYRLKPGGSALLRVCGYVVTVKDVKRDAAGAVTEVHCTHRPGSGEDTKKIKGKLHWVSAKDSLAATVRVFGALLKDDQQEEEEEAAAVEDEMEAKAQKLLAMVNPESMREYKNARLEASLATARPPPAAAYGIDLGEAQSHFQFERSGFFVVDTKSPPAEKGLVLNCTINMKSSSDRPDAAPTRSRKEEQQRQLEEKERRKKIDPRVMFRDDPQYSKFDDDGVPTHGADGEPLQKAVTKKLKKEWDKQKKIYQGPK